MPRLTHEEADKRIEAAMQEPASMRVQRFREMIAERGGRAAQPFAAEREPKLIPTPRLESLPARTQV